MDDIKKISIIKNVKKLDETFRNDVRSRTFKYLNFTNADDKSNLINKCLSEGYLCIGYKGFEDLITPYDFYNLELLTSSNFNVEHNIERNSSKKIRNRNGRMEYNEKSILNCALNLSLAVRSSNLLKTRDIKVFEKLIEDDCDGICDSCKLEEYIEEYEKLNNIIFPSRYENEDFYINSKFEIRSCKNTQKEISHINKFKLNTNLERFEEIKRNLNYIKRFGKISEVNVPRYYSTILINNYIDEAKNKNLRLERLIKVIEKKIEEATPNRQD